MPGKSAASFFKAAANVLDQVSGHDGQLRRVWQTINPWITRFATNAAIKWLPIIANEAPCQIGNPDGQGGWTQCSQPAVSFCDCCGRPTCLHHGRFDSNAGVICFPCVATAQAVARTNRTSSGAYAPPPPPSDAPPKEAKPPPKPKMDRGKALQILGLGATATPEEIRVRYKAMAKKWHPDKHEDADKSVATSRFREIQEAWESLKA
jgi:hypothetical protein